MSDRKLTYLPTAQPAPVFAAAPGSADAPSAWGHLYVRDDGVVVWRQDGCSPTAPADEYTGSAHATAVGLAVGRAARDALALGGQPTETTAARGQEETVVAAYRATHPAPADEDPAVVAQRVFDSAGPLETWLGMAVRCIEADRAARPSAPTVTTEVRAALNRVEIAARDYMESAARHEDEGNLAGYHQRKDIAADLFRLASAVGAAHGIAVQP